MPRLLKLAGLALLAALGITAWLARSRARAAALAPAAYRVTPSAHLLLVPRAVTKNKPPWELFPEYAGTDVSWESLVREFAA